MMLLDLAMIAGGLVVLVFAGDALVKGAVNLSLRLGIPALIVGLTVVAFGTSAPELIVSVQAVLSGVPALALGNVVGSNTANILLVLGIPALIAAIPVARNLTRDYVIMIAASVLFIALAFGLFGFLGDPMLARFLADFFLAQRVFVAFWVGVTGRQNVVHRTPQFVASDYFMLTLTADSR